MKHILLSYLLLFTFAAHVESMLADEVPDDSIPTVRLLAIGNSFSADAVEHHYLQGIAKASNINLIIGHAFNGGYNLSSVWSDINDAKEGPKLRYYRKIDKDGHMTTYDDYTLLDAIDDEQWDCITLQQASGESGRYHTYEPFLGNIINYFRTRFSNTNLKLGFHMVWPYANRCTLAKFKYYNYDQATMYNAILDATRQTMQNHPDLDFLIPSGTAVQNLRSTFIGDNIDRDGYHLNTIGRYTAAYTWFATLFQDKVASDTHFPYTLNAFTSQIAKNAATAAIANPYSVTPQIYQDYLGENAITPADIYINFSHLGTNTPQWNDITREYDMTTGLIDSEGKDAGIIVFQTEKFCNASSSGPIVTHTELNMPADVSKTSVTGYSEGTNGNTAPKPSCAFSFQHMNKALAYDFAVFSSSTYTPGNRESLFQLVGADTIAASINTTNNTSQLLIFHDVRPDNDGTITLSVSAGPNNDTANKFYYLNALRISAFNPEDGLQDVEMPAYIHARKVLKNKNLYIVRDGEVYSPDGKRVR